MQQTNIELKKNVNVNIKNKFPIKSLTVPARYPGPVGGNRGPG